MTTEEIQQLIQGGGDLQSALLARLLEKKQARSSSEGRAASSRVIKRVRRLEREHRAMVELCSELSEALGACPCFGSHHCKVCHGRGRPGWRAPNEEAFMTHVVPLLERMGLLANDETAPNYEGTIDEDIQR